MRAKSFIFLKIVYFSLIVFILETVFFHVLNYIYDYLNAVLIISYTVLGIGLGAFISGRIKIPEKYLFAICSLGTVFSLYLVAFKTIFFPSGGITNFVFFFCFLFPSVYISKIYAEEKIGQIYLLDMVGGLFGVFFVFFLYFFLFSESIFFLILLIIPLVALINISFQKLKYEKIIIFILLLFLILGSSLFYNQVLFDKYNLFNLINCNGIEKSPEGTAKIFCRNVELIKSYDNLVGRIDITQITSLNSSSYTVSYEGWPNDIFHKKILSTKDDYSSNKNKEWPTLDIRFLYGIKEEPEILIIGSAAQGIIPTIRKITPLEKITSVEINPSIIKIMKEDFFEESGRAYLNFTPILGNGISFLKSNNKKFDMITMMNVHPYRNISHQGPPDYLHTIENYRNILNSLSEEGYLMIEERPETLESKLALYREINTIWHALKKEGAENPSNHFVIWSWMYENKKFEKYKLFYFTGIAVFKNPIKKEWVDPWIQRQNLRDQFNLQYFNGYKNEELSKEFLDLFAMIESNNFSSLQEENFDSSVVTNNRPFLTQSTLKTPKLNNLLKDIGILTLVLWIIFTIPLIRSEKRKLNMALNMYHILVAFAFFSIQIILFQVYQNIFISPSLSFIFVLGFLLLFSGIGGYFSEKFNLKNIIIFLIPTSLIAAILPNSFYFFNIHSSFINFLSVSFVLATGFLMGFYFPKGLNFIKKIESKEKVYYFYAIDAVVSCFAVPLTLYLGIKIGYFSVIIIGILCYVLATIILSILELHVKEKI
ncbi:MAG: hypothetical protein PHQ08_02050 [Candidatus Pacebacteria bacterium]|nr:hypothetical protein [Candidatus Paceibacterota bacterium]MDD4897517.1 hypothetical protein [Candidatus Paceibacterota bacterium]